MTKHLVETSAKLLTENSFTKSLACASNYIFTVYIDWDYFNMRSGTSSHEGCGLGMSPGTSIPTYFTPPGLESKEHI